MSNDPFDSGDWMRAANPIDQETLHRIAEMSRIGDMMQQHLERQAKKQSATPKPLPAPQFKLSLSTDTQMSMAQADQAQYVDLTVTKKPAKASSMQIKPDAESLEKLIYEIRDEWCSDAGEWDASKIPVPELADRLARKLKESSE